VRWLAALLLLAFVAPLREQPAFAQDRLQKPPDAIEMDVANHWQALDLASKNLGAALGRLVEDRRKLREELDALKPKPEASK
jgi:hypothetical protein